MANIVRQTKPSVWQSLQKLHIPDDRINRALHVYEKNYAIYDINTVTEIVYRLDVKDKVASTKQTLFPSLSAVRSALSAMALGEVYINMALQQYQLERPPQNASHFDLRVIVEIIMGLRVLYPPQNNLSELDQQRQRKLLPRNASQSAPSQPSQPSSRTVSASSQPSRHSKNSKTSKTSKTSKKSSKSKSMSRSSHDVHGHCQPSAPFIAMSPQMESKEMENVVASMLSVERNAVHIRSDDTKSKSKMHSNVSRMASQCLSTEREYVDGLSLLLRAVLMPLTEHGYVEKQYHSKVLSSLPQILGVHEELLTELHTAVNSNFAALPNVLVAFLVRKRERMAVLYGRFREDYGDVLDLFGTTFHGNKLLDQFLKRVEKEKGLKLLSYLR